VSRPRKVTLADKKHDLRENVMVQLHLLDTLTKETAAELARRGDSVLDGPHASEVADYFEQKLADITRRATAARVEWRVMVEVLGVIEPKP